MAKLEKEFRLRIGNEVWETRTEADWINDLRSMFEDVRSQYGLGLREQDIPKPPTIEEQIREMLKNDYGISEKLVQQIYHPSAIATYPAAKDILGSPRIPSIKNPVFMRTMHRLRAIVNELIRRGVVDRETCVRVEVARELTTANERKAIYRYQKERERENAQFRKEIEELGYTITSEQDPRVLKYRLWKEQEGRCLYTGKQISATGFLADPPAFDFEHTIPQSRRFDDSQANLTLCDVHFNRQIKGNRMPSELPNHPEILERVRALWIPRIEEHEAACAKYRSTSRRAADKSTKDNARQNLHYHQQHLRYWREKLANFEAKEVPEGFTHRQLVDTRIITKYAVLYQKAISRRCIR